MTGTASLLLALTLVVASGNWLAVERGRRGLEYIFKPLTMVVLVSATLALDVPDESVRAWFLVALALCLVGDVLLMLPQDRFVFGLGAFLLGHVAYIGGLSAQGLSPIGLAVGVLVVLVAVALAGVRVLRAVRASDEPALAGPVGAYMAVISAMVVSAFGTGSAVAVAGAASFYASDALIAWNRFVGATPHHRLAIMVTYHLGQVGLVLSLL